MAFDFIFPETRKELKKHKEAILKLFRECFNKKLSSQLWDWAYLDNPIKGTFVSLCYDKNLLVGHYAVIPLTLRRCGIKINSALSMTTMVHPKYRRNGLFTKQANQIYEKTKNENIDVIIGFPNKNSKSGFMNRLNWKIGPTDSIVNVKKIDLINCSEFMGNICKNNFLSLDFENELLLKWRLSKPGSIYYFLGQSILKKYNESIDVIYLDKDFEKYFEENCYYNLLINHKIRSLEIKKKVDYQFGYLNINDKIVDFRNLKKDLILSDVF